MDGSYGYSSYQNGLEKKDFNKIAQNVGSSIQKISQNGRVFYFSLNQILTNIISFKSSNSSSNNIK